MFCDGNEKVKSSIAERIIIEELISSDILIDLISFILSSHDFVNSFSFTKEEIQLSFLVNKVQNNMKGISCGKFTINLNFRAYPNPEKIMYQYLKIIISNFYDKLKTTATFKKEYTRYCESIKEKLIFSLNKAELNELIGKLTREELQDLLLNLSLERITQIYENCIQNKNCNSTINLKEIK